MASWFNFWESKGIRQGTTGITGPKIVRTTSPRTIILGITIHEILLNKMKEIRRMIPGRI